MMEQRSKKLSILNLCRQEPPLWLRVTVPLIDRVMGIPELNRLYHEYEMSGLPPGEFYQKFIECLRLKYEFSGSDFSTLPTQGPAIVVANHPHGGIEGVMMRHLIFQHRSDFKVLSNLGISIFPEMNEHSIYTNPLSNNAKGNTSSLRTCLEHLRQGGVLVLFAAGRVSYPHGTPEAITDHRWNRIVASLQRKVQCPLYTVHISGQNRPMFYKLGKIWYRMRLLMLAREMLASRDRKLTFTISRPIKKLPPAHAQQQTDLLYLLTYLNAVKLPSWPKAEEQKMQPLAPAVYPEALAAEVSALPEGQKLASFKSYTTYWTLQSQSPQIVNQIRRLREETFRTLDEGSGKPFDGDDFDATYVHLFIYDQENPRVIGAYRMGRSDELMKGGLDQLYLSRVFEFKEGFINRQRAALEMGRSFVVSDQQRSYHGLLLLFLGIGAFVKKFPQYRVLYGTVSLSMQYSPLSVAVIQRWLCEPSGDVSALSPFDSPVIPQLEHYLAMHKPTLEHLDWLVRQIELDGKGLPVLLKQYYQMGARFYCIGIDKNFAGTPGLLLSVNLDNVPEKLLKLYRIESSGKSL